MTRQVRLFPTRYLSIVKLLLKRAKRASSMKKIKIASAEYFIKFITSEMNSPHKNDKKFAQMFVLPDFFFFTIY